jgi:hypothetical protein
MKNAQKAAFADVGEAAGNFLAAYIAEKLRDLEGEA